MKYKQARWREASRDIDVVTSARSMYIVRPKDPYFSPNRQISVLLFISFCNAASPSDKTALDEDKVWVRPFI